jgi:protein-tyrosine phosphatase
MKIVFVCTGNVFRSVVAEGLCRKFLKEQELDRAITVDSAGIGDSCGNRRPAPILREFLAERGIDVGEHRSKRLTEETIRTAGLIIPMTRRQERKILTTLPSAEGKTYLLGRFDPLADHPDIKVTWEPVSEMMWEVYDAIYPAVLGLIKSKGPAGGSPGLQGRGSKSAPATKFKTTDEVEPVLGDTDRLRSELDRTFLRKGSQQMFDRSRFVDDLPTVKAF